MTTGVLATSNITGTATVLASITTTSYTTLRTSTSTITATSAAITTTETTTSKIFRIISTNSFDVYEFSLSVQNVFCKRDSIRRKSSE